MMMGTKQRHSHHYSILATDVRLVAAKYEEVVKPGMETDRTATAKASSRRRAGPTDSCLN